MLPLLQKKITSKVLANISPRQKTAAGPEEITSKFSEIFLQGKHCCHWSKQNKVELASIAQRPGISEIWIETTWKDTSVITREMVTFLCKPGCPCPSLFFVFNLSFPSAGSSLYAKLVKLQKVDAFNPVIGGYDKLAITFGYMPVEELLKWLFVCWKGARQRSSYW